jgi:ferredoxin, 2Fe-2S
MTALTIISRAGKEVTVAESGDRSVMEVIRDAGVEERFALCQGSLSCATCHVYVDPAFMDCLTPAADYELDLLSSSDYQKDNSRLSCQIPCNAKLNDLRVTVAPED